MCIRKIKFLLTDGILFRFEKMSPVLNGMTKRFYGRNFPEISIRTS